MAKSGKTLHYVFGFLNRKILLGTQVRTGHWKYASSVQVFYLFIYFYFLLDFKTSYDNSYIEKKNKKIETIYIDKTREKGKI